MCEKHERGIVVCVSHPRLAASPDRMVESAAALTESKCPTTKTMYRSLDAPFTSGKCNVRYLNGELILDPRGKNGYYTQVQVQMFCIGMDTCDFIVCISQDAVVVSLSFDAAFV